MSLTLVLLLLAGAISGSYLLSDKKPSSLEEQQKLIALPAIQSNKQQFKINWWRTIDKQQLDINQYHYLPNLELATGLRHILIPYSSGYVKAFRLKDGEWEWSLDTKQKITAGIATSQSRYAYVGGRDGQITQFNNLSGKIGWQIHTGNTIIALKIHRKTLFSYNIDGQLAAIDIPTGKIRWSVTHSQPVSSIYGTTTPLIADDLVLMGSANGQLYAYSIDNGTKRWQALLGQVRGFSEIESLIDVDATVAIFNDRIISSAFGGPIKALDSNSRKELWQYAASTIDPIISFKNNPKQIVIQTNEDKIISLNPQNGKLLWENNRLKFRRLSRLQVLPNNGKKLLVGMDKLANLLLLDSKTGKLFYRYQAEYPLAMSPLIYRKNIYTLNQNGELLSYRLITPKP